MSPTTRNRCPSAAVWRIEVADFPAFLVVDDKGNDFFIDVNRASPAAAPVTPR